jgi:xanthine dehydrogenase iron-sulfur cluster and FAD-binding subunit A
MDGNPIRSCVTSIDSVGTSAITTIEAIGNTPAGRTIQRTWLDLEVVQCGYCQSGQIMSASALLANNPVGRTRDRGLRVNAVPICNLASMHQDAPIRMPVASTMAPPRTICKAALTKGVSIYRVRTKAMIQSSQKTTTPAIEVAIQNALGIEPGTR